MLQLSVICLYYCFFREKGFPRFISRNKVYTSSTADHPRSSESDRFTEASSTWVFMGTIQRLVGSQTNPPIPTFATSLEPDWDRCDGEAPKLDIGAGGELLQAILAGPAPILSSPVNPSTSSSLSSLINTFHRLIIPAHLHDTFNFHASPLFAMKADTIS